MKKNNRINFIVTGLFLLLFIALTVALGHVDVQPIGPNGSSVGFASLNGWVSEALGVNMLLYTITDLLGLVVILYAFCFAVLGIVQLFTRKSIKRVDYSILVLGGFYLLVIVAFAFFEFNVINYRPTLIEGRLEASFPSSTTMLVMCIIPTAIMQFNRLIKTKKARITVNMFTAALGLVSVIGRIFSGVHWITDILGGFLLSLTLVTLYYSVNKLIESKLQDPDNIQA